MDNQDQIRAVQNMQVYIMEHVDTHIMLRALTAVSGYSHFYALRLFKQYIGQTPFQYIRAVRLSQAAMQLRDCNDTVTSAAFDNRFESHDGFTRAFYKQFGLLPAAYQKNKPAIGLFTYYPISHARVLLTNQKRMNANMTSNKVSGTVTVQAVQRPERKLLFLRSKKAVDYLSFCNEMGCEWDGLLNSIAEKFDTAALVELPPHLIKEGTSPFAAGIEIPADYNKPIPENMEIVTLPPCKMLYFCGMPYENEEDFCEAIEIVAQAVMTYQPEAFGLCFADALAPRFNFGASAKSGARMAVPVVDKN